MWKKSIIFLPILITTLGITFSFPNVFAADPPKIVNSPKIIYPLQDAVITTMPLKLQWTPQSPLGAGYYWEIYSGNTLIDAGPTAYDQPFVNIDCLSSGGYAWRVRNCSYDVAQNKCLDDPDRKYNWKQSNFTVSGVNCGTAQTTGNLQPPSTPQYPVDGQTNVSLELTLKWQNVQGAKSYRYFYWAQGGETNKKQKLTNSSPGNFSSGILGLDAEGTKHFWQIQSCNDPEGRTCGQLSNVWSFTTCASCRTLTGGGTDGRTIEQQTGAPQGKLQVKWPKNPLRVSLQGDSLTNLIEYLYGWGISLGGFAAFVVLVMAGIQYLTSAGDAGKMKEAIDKIRNAAIGLVMLFASVLILNTINPQLTQLRMPSTKPESVSLGVSTENLRNFATEPCDGAKLYSAENYQPEPPVTLKAGEYDCKNFLLIPVNSIRVNGSCQVKLSEKFNCAENESSPAIIIFGDTPRMSFYGKTRFNSVQLIDAYINTDSR